MPRIVVPNEVQKNRKSPTTSASPIPKMADIKGATSIAPIMVAGLLSSNPNDAIAAARVIITVKSVPPRETTLRFHGADRDDGAIRGALANAERAGVDDLCVFTRAPVSALARPEGPPGLVMVNPPYGERIGNRKLLFALYGSLGAVLKERFAGWRVGIVTSDGGLAKATGLPFLPPGPPVAHGGLTVKLWLTEALGQA